MLARVRSSIAAAPPLARLAGAVGLAVSAAACDGVGGAAGVEPPPVVSTSGALVRVDVTYTHEAGTPPGAIRYDAQGHFARFRPSGARRVPTLLGMSDAADDALPLDGCRVTDATSELDAALASRAPVQVTLLDAGRLEVRGAPLTPTHVPDLVPFVSGVVYGGPDEGAPTPPLQLGQPYTVSGSGTDEIGPIQASVTAPRTWPTIAVAPTVRRGADLEVRWSPEPSPSTAPSTTEAHLEVRWATAGGSRAVRCRTTDDGVHVVPPALLGAVRAGTSLQIAISRVARSPLVAPGLGRGELVLQLRDVATTQVIDGETPTP